LIREDKINGIIEFLQTFKDEGEDWAKDRMPYFRAVLWLFFLYVFIRHVADSDYGSIFSGINLGIHELGHVILSPFGQFIMVCGGTLFQLAAPIASFFIFLKQSDYFALSVSLAWLSTSFFGVAKYSGDAEKMLLPLVSPFGGDDIVHDWNYLLETTGLLGLTPVISGFFWLMAFFCMAIALIWGGFLLKIMFRDAIDKIR
jgi:hypothetical protein